MSAPQVFSPTAIDQTVTIDVSPQIGDSITGSLRRTPTGVSAAFLGIPYAAPPVGELRFLAPQPRDPWQGTFDGTRPGATPQRRPPAPVTTIPEPSITGSDILNLNVFTPAPNNSDAKLPVLVWIHGG